MGSITQLRHEALQLLEQRLIPGAQATQLHSSVTRLAQILEELESHGEPAIPALRTIKQRTQGIENRIVLLLTDQRLEEQPSFIRQGLELLLYDLESLHQEAPANAYLIPHQHNEHKLKDASTLKHFTHIPYSYLQATPTVSVKTLTALALSPEPAKTYRVVTQPAQQGQWNLELIGQHALPSGYDGAGITIGVVDTGVDYTHEALAQRFGDDKGYDFINNNDDPMDQNGHGTHVAGTVAGDSIGVAQQATLYALRFLDAHGRGSEVDFIRAAEWAIDHQLHIINGSFGSARPSKAEKAICDALEQHGILFAAAAGNDGSSDYNYPASYPSVISVAAVDRHKERAGFSQRNDQLTIAAPGVDIYSSVPGGYAEYSGTSMATPHIAGSLAVVRALHTDAAYAREVLIKAAEELGAQDEYGSGLVRVDKAAELDSFRKRWAA